MLSSCQYHADYVMADPAKLRMCETLLAKLPERVPTRVRNPIWVFLKEIEGFDNDRACDCLVKLLDKHYDTIGVLKLATKRDLIEDAGIQPGDALRIVSAVRNYVAPRDVNRSSESTSRQDASKLTGVDLRETHQVLQGVENRQNAYIPPALREKTVIFTPPVPSEANTCASLPQVQQEKKAKIAAPENAKSEAQEAVERAAPKLENAKEVKVVMNQTSTKPVVVVDYAQTIPVGITYPHTCRLCNIKCISESISLSHYRSKKHTAKFAEQHAEIVQQMKQRAQTPKALLKEAKKPAQAQEVVWEATQSGHITPVAPVHACGVCNVKCGSEIDLRSHFNGRRHAQSMELAVDSNDNRPTAYLHCSICNIACTCRRNLVMHMIGKKHSKNIEVESESGDSDSFFSNSGSDCL